MYFSIDNIVLIGSILLFAGIFAGKLSYRFGLPILMLFLCVGMLFGSDGLGLHFDNPRPAQFIGLMALNIILFSGGMDTKFSDIRPIAVPGIVLATLGVLLTALITGFFIYWLTHSWAGAIRFSLLEALLLASVMSSTDSASVFGILRSKGIALKERLKPLLEFESGSNDPMAYLLTITFIQLIQLQSGSVWTMLGFFFFQFLFGAFMGWALGKLFIRLLNRIHLPNLSLYPVLLVAICFFIFALTNELKGNGYLAVYIGGLIIGNARFSQKYSSKRFFDGLTWLFQIIMFLCLGLLVNPKDLLPICGIGLLISLFLIWIARPLAVFLCLLPFRKLSLQAKTYTSWVGLRGAVPIIFATYALTADVEKAPEIFNIVFFVTLVSLLLQGTTIPIVARWLHLADRPEEKPLLSEFEIELPDEINSVMREIIVRPEDLKNGSLMKEISIPSHTLVMLVKRKDEYFVPTGSSRIEPDDVLLLISDDKKIKDPA
ncbi:MAG: potassium/proton antiporter [Dysgonamonadaceae bacterium]|jgi:cell volume regulation protein A|nr:potassium/proton antiporter [Dysgonamonadaceae bacterium]